MKVMSYIMPYWLVYLGKLSGHFVSIRAALEVVSSVYEKDLGIMASSYLLLCT